MEEKDLIVPDATPGVQPSEWLPHNVVAIDGSWATHEVRNGFPGAEISVNTVVSVLLRVNEMVTQDRIRRPMDPTVYRKLTPSDPMVTMFPGHNVMVKGTDNARLAFREKVFSTLGSKGMLISFETLLQTYEAILQKRISEQGPTGARDIKCPWGPDCAEAGQAQQTAFVMSAGEYECACPGKKRLYSTDALRLQESFNDNGPSGRMFGEAQQVLEHLWLLNVIKTFVGHRTMDALAEMAFIMDGTLKIDGTPSWLAAWIGKELREINDSLIAQGGPGLCIVGVEKTGNFVEHFKRLDTTARGRGDALPNGYLLLLTSQYIRENIAPGDRPYYDNTYYGRKFFYKTKTGSLICATVPFLSNDARDVTREPADPSQFPRLADVLNLLDKLVSDRYEDSLIPIIAAHSEAAIPLQQGKRVLEALLKEYMQSST
ncbi:MAG TPA: hypothetical protein VMF61_00235 [Candidatus Acidoferrales bacterium]|nr:hypothetical protein [Candidatus Acidoferrales bacterium]